MALWRIQHQTQRQQCWRLRVGIASASFFVLLLALSSSVLSASASSASAAGSNGSGRAVAAALPVPGTLPPLLPPINSKARGGHVHRGAAPLLLASTYSTVSRNVRVALAGGIAGAVGTAVLYPVDTAKTLRQANPTRYQSVRHALMDLIFPNVDLANTAATTAVTTAAAMQQRTTTTRRILRIQKAYRGVLPATLGAIPSSALYFGAYETMKTFISKVVPDNTFASRLTIHALAAATGNALSSLIFVPKELIKQQLQFSDSNTSTIRTIVSSTLKESGIRGLYCGYQATLIRNIPSAIIRFVLYEEFKYKCMSDDHESHSNSSNFNNNMLPKLFLAGALAGAIASGFMTPVDVVKTRLATKTIPTKGFLRSLHYLLETEGPRALYAGAPSRMIWSGAFSAIGFGTFETAKTALGVNAIIAADTTVHTTTGAADKFEGNLSK